MGTATLKATYNGSLTQETPSQEEDVIFDIWTSLVLEGFESPATTVTSITANMVRDDGETLELVIEFDTPSAKAETTEQVEETV